VRWGGVLFGAGGVLAALSLAVPHGPVRWPGLGLIDAFAGIGFGALLFAVGRRIQPWMIHALMVIGNLQVAIGIQVLGRGPLSVTASGFYVWTTVFAFYFFSWRAAALHVATIGVFLAGTLFLLHEPAGPGIWLVSMGTAAVAGVVVGALSRQLRLTAGTDGLTGLPNRWSWEDALDRELVRAARTNDPVCVASIDLDGFKALNDERGHQAGDRFLRQLALAWSGAIRGNDLLARYGGDEFAVLLPQARQEQAVAVVDRMRDEAPEASFSAGVAEWDRVEAPDSLLGRADIAVYRAKTMGRDVTVVADDEVDSRDEVSRD
jgi:diguanylate cyclase (GGDEF)-like protein